ncbi:hypothetical protein EJ06DRAFT_527713 [Trichodelitschia bisporula]|uniref:Uncharacterized protein n=1 Tax=Trichodelitschia bisporula TaxID=703511 RepID=A0A6G1I377_9PEZI|nr:hypothetical protein EJ06DRAFT_527713 [Trichodelitschia bisporula]
MDSLTLTALTFLLSLAIPLVQAGCAAPTPTGTRINDLDTIVPGPCQTHGSKCTTTVLHNGNQDFYKPCFTYLTTKTSTAVVECGGCDLHVKRWNQDVPHKTTGCGSAPLWLPWDDAWVTTEVLCEGTLATPVVDERIRKVVPGDLVTETSS